MARVAFMFGKITNIGGIPRVVSLLTHSLIENSEHQIIIISYLKGREEGYKWNSQIEFFHLIDTPTNMRRGILEASISLRKVIKKNNIDILVSCGSLFGPLGVFGTIFNNTKFIYWDHSNYLENTSHKFKIKSKQFTALFTDALVTLTKVDEQQYSKNTYAKKIVQIYNPIDPKLENLKHLYDASSKLIISVGRLTEQKNFLELVEVAKIVFDSLPNYEWHIFGSGNQKDLIQERIDHYGLNGKLILMGQSDELYQKYANYSLMVMTSKYEGFPMTLLEGMANYIPLISYDILTGPNEIIKSDINGYLISPFQTKEMADKIIFTLSNPKIREKFAENNMTMIEQFNCSSITSKWTKLIEETLSK